MKVNTKVLENYDSVAKSRHSDLLAMKNKQRE